MHVVVANLDISFTILDGKGILMSLELERDFKGYYYGKSAIKDILKVFYFWKDH